MDNMETAAQAAPVPEGPKLLMGVWALLEKTWSVYKNKFWLAIGILVAPVVLMTLASYVGQTDLSPVASIISLVAALIMFWAQGALVLLFLNRESDLSVKSAYKNAWPKYWSLLWVSVLTTFITLGGFWLFVIPGLIFTVWFMFSMVVLMAEGERGIKALVKSREYVRNNFWPVVGRYFTIMILVLLAYAILGIVTAGLTDSDIWSVILANLLMLFVIPALVIYQVLLYEDLKAAKGVVEVKEQAKTTYLLIGAAGWVFIIIIALLATSLMMSVLGFILGGGLSNDEDLPEGFEVPGIQINLPAEVQEQLEQLAPEGAVS
ncbi:MAG TPA: hypothetical protein PLY95_02500 [Candidatus Paceibacterota bacterium]|nr:hypothetical protein [Candidatus Paceibacterota bacterium]HQI26101.1 hypothetical protein [Candidatus Paceibacterota bacterium]HQJ83986.1 hypothetical protein [Candidatus Paceibacterota bacterium]